MPWSHTESEQLEGDDVEKVWAIWSDVPKWPTWDIDMAESTLSDPAAGFVSGSKGAVKMVSGVKADFILYDVVINQQFKYSVKVPGAVMVFTFLMERDTDQAKLKLTHGAEYSGMFGGLYGWVFRDMTVKGLAAAVKNIKGVLHPPNPASSPPPGQ